MTAATPPRKRNAPKTRAAILAAAQAAFCTRGYDQVGIRDIAAAAGVSSPLLLRYFGSKAGLFEAALHDSLTTAREFPWDKAGFGEVLTRSLVERAINMNPPIMLALSICDPDAQDIARRVTEKHILKPLEHWLGPPDARARALQINTLAMGFVLYSQQVSIDSDETARNKFFQWFADSVQAIVDNR